MQFNSKVSVAIYDKILTILGFRVFSQKFYSNAVSSVFHDESQKTRFTFRDKSQ